MRFFGNRKFTLTWRGVCTKSLAAMANHPKWDGCLLHYPLETSLKRKVELLIGTTKFFIILIFELWFNAKIRYSFELSFRLFFNLAFANTCSSIILSIYFISSMFQRSQKQFPYEFERPNTVFSVYFSTKSISDVS